MSVGDRWAGSRNSEKKEINGSHWLGRSWEIYWEDGWVGAREKREKQKEKKKSMGLFTSPTDVSFSMSIEDTTNVEQRHVLFFNNVPSFLK